MFEAYFDDAGLAVGLSYPNSDYQSFLNAGNEIVDFWCLGGGGEGLWLRFEEARLGWKWLVVVWL